MPDTSAPRIKIMAKGPYIVTGGVPLLEFVIEPRGRGYVYRQKREFPLQERYALCRCGKSKNMPFCDGEHVKRLLWGRETASRKPYLELAKRTDGPGVYLTDYEDLCAFARFCHADEGSTWQLIRKSDDPVFKRAAIKTAAECPAGRLVVWDYETNLPYEEPFEPSIVLLQDPQRDCSGPLWVRGGIQIEAADGFEYEVRNRVTLCRCGKSKNMPFCDAAHVSCHFQDNL